MSFGVLLKLADQHWGTQLTELIQRIRDGVIGERRLFNTPYGVKPLIYADYVASGRSLSFIEDEIRDHVLPWYANTHTESSFTGAQTTRWREWARDTIRDAVKGGPQDRVIFCGSGATAAINKAIELLELRHQQANVSRPLVVIGPYEHHSNELCWRELEVDVVTVPLTGEGLLDVSELENILAAHQDRKLVIGSFSAASNVTGLKTDTKGIARLLKQYGALSLWDYAAAAPYVEIDMVDKDAIFLSPHKFIGGPGTPGVLVINENVIQRVTPTVPGGGTVSFVSPSSHRYVADMVRREEAGTPAIVDSIRAGLVFELKEKVGASLIEEKENGFIQRAIARLSDNPNVEILGNRSAPRLPILAFRMFDDGAEVHYGLVVALLNDLFGIQTRGGCSCAGPYAHRLLEIDSNASLGIDQNIKSGDLSARPGWVRLSFNYFIDEDTFDYIVNAVELTADCIATLKQDYLWKCDAGIFVHRATSQHCVQTSLRPGSHGSIESCQLSGTFASVKQKIRVAQVADPAKQQGYNAAVQLP